MPTGLKKKERERNKDKYSDTNVHSQLSEARGWDLCVF